MECDFTVAKRIPVTPIDDLPVSTPTVASTGLVATPDSPVRRPPYPPSWNTMASSLLALQAAVQGSVGHLRRNQRVLLALGADLKAALAPSPYMKATLAYRRRDWYYTAVVASLPEDLPPSV